MKILTLFMLLISAHSSFALELVGEGKYSWFVFDIYKAKLWSGSPNLAQLYDNRLKLELEYTRDFAGQDISKQSEKEMLNAGLEQEYISKWRAKLYSAFPNVKEGDKLMADFIPNKGINIYHNEKLYSSIMNEEFAMNFLNIWLGDKTSAPELRDKLIKGIR